MRADKANNACLGGIKNLQTVKNVLNNTLFYINKRINSLGRGASNEVTFNMEGMN